MKLAEFRQDRMPVLAWRLASGTVWVGGVPRNDVGRVVLCARVSGRDQRSGLGRRVARLTGRAAGQGLAVAEAVCEVGSGMGRSPAQVAPDLVGSVCHADRRGAPGSAGCVGTERLGAALAAAGRRVLVAGPGETSDDLVRDMIEVLAGMCARRGGRRRARNRAMRAVTAANHAGEDGAAA